MNRADIISTLFGDDNDEEVDDIDQEDNHFNSTQIYRLAKEDKISSVGGGRGLFAAYDIDVGSLIISEVPLLLWPSDLEHSSPESLAYMADAIFNSENSLRATIKMFPQSLDDISTDEIQCVKQHLSERLYTKICDGRNENEVLRILLVLQHNGFSSGFYDNFTLINHSCNPNCIKFNPQSGSRKISEIWSTRPIKAGEEITITYSDIRERSKSYINEYLNSNHSFTCHCESCMNEEKITSSIDLKFEEFLDEIESELRMVQSSNEMNITEELHFYHQLLMSIEDTTTRYQLLTSPIPQFIDSTETHNHHYENENDAIVRNPDNTDGHESVSILIRSRLYKQAVKIAAIYLGKASQIPINKKSKSKHIVLEIKQNAFRFLKYSIALAPLQEMYLGNQHPDIASTLIDISQGILALIDNNTNEDFLQLFSNEENSKFFMLHSEYYFSSVATARRIANVKRSEGERIASLYCTSKKYPEALLLSNPGDSYWGKTSKNIFPEK